LARDSKLEFSSGFRDVIIHQNVREVKRRSDIVVASIHWAVIGDMISFGSKLYLPIDLSMRPVLILFTGIHRIMSEESKFIKTNSFYTAAVTF
jgi:hypothetical protein